MLLYTEKNTCVTETGYLADKARLQTPDRGYSILGSCSTRRAILHWPNACEFHNSVIGPYLLAIDSILGPGKNGTDRETSVRATRTRSYKTFSIEQRRCVFSTNPTSQKSHVTFGSHSNCFIITIVKLCQAKKCYKIGSSCSFQFSIGFNQSHRKNVSAVSVSVSGNDRVISKLERSTQKQDKNT